MLFRFPVCCRYENNQASGQGTAASQQRWSIKIFTSSLPHSLGIGHNQMLPKARTSLQAYAGPVPLIIPDPRYFSIPSVVVGGIVFRNRARNCTPCVANGVGTSRAVRIYKTYGADAIQVISEDPYRIVHAKKSRPSRGQKRHSSLMLQGCSARCICF